MRISTYFRYDGAGHLQKVLLPDGGSIHYVHDALGRRIGKVKNGQLQKGWLHADGLRPVAQLNSAGQLEATFVYATRANVRDFIVKSGSSSITYRVIADHLGTPRAIVNATTGAVAYSLELDEFGVVVSESGEAGLLPHGFAGGLWDREIGLVRFGARDYEPYTGRWTAKDPSLFQGGDSNLYAYAASDPANHIDPDGKFWIVAGAAVVVIGAAYVYDAWAEVQGLRSEARTRYPEDPGRANAWQHCTGACQLAVSRGMMTAYALGYGREYSLNLFDDAEDRRRDLANNACGIAQSQMVEVGLGAECRGLCADGPNYTPKNSSDNPYSGAP